MALADKIQIGAQYRFNYPTKFVSLPAYSAQRGDTVTVIRQLTQDEADQGEGMERMFCVRAEDGWEGAAWASELAPL